jgi:seryl-tRNA synthetase
MTGEGAKLMRALRNFTLDLHTNDGYTEVIPPTLINEPSLYGLGKIPFFQEDMYKTDENLYLTATEEFPITAMFSNEILDIKSLPLRYTGSNCS